MRLYEGAAIIPASTGRTRSSKKPLHGLAIRLNLEEGNASAYGLLDQYCHVNPSRSSSSESHVNWLERAQLEVNRFYFKNAREFKRQEKKYNAVPLTPGFDEDGFPTYEEDD